MTERDGKLRMHWSTFEVELRHYHSDTFPAFITSSACADDKTRCSGSVSMSLRAAVRQPAGDVTAPENARCQRATWLGLSSARLGRVAGATVTPATTTVRAKRNHPFPSEAATRPSSEPTGNGCLICLPKPDPTGPASGSPQ